MPQRGHVDDVLVCAGARHALYVILLLEAAPPPLMSIAPERTLLVSMWLEDGVVDRTLTLKRREAARRQTVARRILGPVA